MERRGRSKGGQHARNQSLCAWKDGQRAKLDMKSRGCKEKHLGHGWPSNLVKEEKEGTHKRACDHKKGNTEKGELLFHQEKLRPT